MIRNYPPHHELPYRVGDGWLEWKDMTREQKAALCRRKLGVGDNEEAWAEALAELNEP